VPNIVYVNDAENNLFKEIGKFLKEKIFIPQRLLLNQTNILIFVNSQNDIDYLSK
jgi:hypothetical protein